MAPVIMSSELRQQPLLALRALNIPFSLIAMILFAVTTSVSKLNYGGNDWTDGLPLAPVSCHSCCCVEGKGEGKREGKAGDAPVLQNCHNPSRMRLSKRLT